MRIFVHDYSGHPFQVQLSRELARRGHSVTHAHCPSYVSGKGRLEREPGDPVGFEALALSLAADFDKYSPLRRIRQELEYGRRCAAAIDRVAPDVVLDSNTPLIAARAVVGRCRRRGYPHVFWQQDVYGQGMRDEVARRVPAVGHLLGGVFPRLEARLLRASEAVITISADFLPVLDRFGVARDRAHVIENWAPVDELPMLGRDNAWATAHGLSTGLVLLYSGTLGRKHDPALLLELAREFRSRDDVTIVVVSEGPIAQELRDVAGAEGLERLRVLPYQPYERLPEVLASGDVLLAILEPEAGVFSVPSKILTYLCAGRPVLAAVPGENAAARLLDSAGAGIVVPPHDHVAWRDAAVRLVADGQRRQQMADRARSFAEETFAITGIADRFESILSAAAMSAGRDATRRGRVRTGHAGADQPVETRKRIDDGIAERMPTAGRSWSMSADDVIVVAGAGGFIGGALVADLVRSGHTRVRAVDCKPLDEWYQLHLEAENLVLDLASRDACREAARDARTIYNLAADMGGMGFIENNKALCMLSVLVSTHMLMAAREVGAERFFYASSACVYAAEKQTSPEVTALREEDAYPAMPEDGYGWEKLFTERMCRHFLEDFGLETRVARYHNVYGPHGTYDGGREKAPAAICRKVASAKLTGSHEIEIWGDGEQTRSFMFIDDCVHGTQLLTASDVTEPLNIGSDQLVTINGLVDIVEAIAGVELDRKYVLDAPQGVRGRNSDNSRIDALLGWSPGISLEDGLAQTYRWIEERIAATVSYR
jgi:GDP-D-mannose 3',5'-epimerase